MLKAPFPYAGGKSRVAAEVWRRLGACGRYVEPFAGSAAVLLARPETGDHEVLGDADFFVANFWRAVKADPEAVAAAMDHPAIQADLTARRRWLAKQAPKKEAMLGDPTWCDPEVAGIWAWCRCVVIGAALVETRQGGSDIRPAACAMGIATKAIRTLPEPRKAILAEVMSLHHRMRGVTVMHGDWARLVTEPSMFEGLGVRTPVGVFLDPPYGVDAMVGAKRTYTHHREGLQAEVRAWALKHGANRRVRIALCGYEGEHEDFPPGWTVHSWSSGGFAFSKKQNERRHDERVWFSPGCLPATVQPGLFDTDVA